jgi:AraC-like DNA-binding protein
MLALPVSNRNFSYWILYASGIPASSEKNCGASKRTIQRVFLEETKMNFGKWRQQLRLLHGLQLLASGEKVTAAALEAGYSSPSAFISMFRKQLGTTPMRYLADVNE